MSKKVTTEQSGRICDGRGVSAADAAAAVDSETGGVHPGSAAGFSDAGVIQQKNIALAAADAIKKVLGAEKKTVT